MKLFGGNSLLPRGFRADCVDAFLREAQSRGVAERGSIAVPELTAAGKKTVRALLDDPRYQYLIGFEPKTYHYLLMTFCLESGLVQAAAWRSDAAGTGALARAVETCVTIGPLLEAEDLLRANFPPEISADRWDRFCHAIHAVWAEKMKKRWASRDPGRYVYLADLAAHQLGVSMVLSLKELRQPVREDP